MILSFLCGCSFGATWRIEGISRLLNILLIEKIENFYSVLILRHFYKFS